MSGFVTEVPVVTVQSDAQILLLGPAVLLLKAQGGLLLFSKEAVRPSCLYREDTMGISSLVLKPLRWVSQ